MGNLKLALRILARSPFVTGVAVLSLALGIGTNTAIFSMINELLLAALPVRDPQELVSFSAPGPKPGSQSCGMAGNCEDVFSYAMLRDLEAHPGPFNGIAGFYDWGANLAYKGNTSSGQASMVSGSYFPVLRVQPALGRLFNVDDDKTIGANFIAVLSYGFWQNDLGGDPSIINSTIMVDGQAFTVIGVTAQSFEGTVLGRRPRIYIPLSMRANFSSWFKPKSFDDRQMYWIYLFGRLKPDISLAQATQQINAIYTPIITDVEAPLQKEMSAATMVKFKAKKIVLSDGRSGQSMIKKQSQKPLVFLFAITAIVLLIACANIANLLMARATGRSMEMAVRLSLGASRRQLLTQLLTESLVLSAIGGIVSLFVARWTLAGFIAMLPHDSHTLHDPHLSFPVILFTAALSVVTGVAFGLYPALHSTRPDLVTSIRAGAGQIAGARSANFFRSSLATGQIALSTTLLISAGFFIKSLVNVTHVDLGIRPDSLVTFEISPSDNGYNHERSRVLLERVESDLAALPSITGVTAGAIPILAGDNWGNDVSVEGVTYEPDKDMNANVSEVAPNYFKVIGATMLQGREFTLADAAGGPKVAIVNEAFAKKFNLLPNVVGKHMARGSNAKQLDLEIVGLVRDNKYSDVKLPVPPVVVTPWRQDSLTGDLTFYVRTNGSSDAVLGAIRGVVKKLDPNLPVDNLQSMPRQVAESTFLDRMMSKMAAAFALLATILAAVGLYGVLAYSVAQRTREIGVRMALGADGSAVQGLVLRQVAMMTLIGAVIGVPSAIAIGYLARSQLFEMKGTDPFVIVSATLLLSMVAFLAGYIPALRASRISPMQALRYE